MSNEIVVSTLESIPGKSIKRQFGVVVGVGTVAFGAFSSRKARKAMDKAIKDLEPELNLLGADAVIGLKVSATSAGFPFFRPHTVIVTGTAVELS